jgi:acylpyruvate hydrolase
MKNINIKNSENKIPIGKIICVGRNYREHAEELGNVVPEFPLIFLKSASCLIPSGEKVIHPSIENELHYEAELILLIGTDIKNAKKESAENAIAGYAVGLDMTLRDVQSELIRKGHPWTISKCFDTSGVLSDFILKEDHQLTYNEVIQLKVNGKMRQNCELNKMIFKPSEIVKYISAIMTLERGDLIFTGTPAGVGKVIPGDKIDAEISGIGRIETEIN